MALLDVIAGYLHGQSLIVQGVPLAPDLHPGRLPDITQPVREQYVLVRRGQFEVQRIQDGKIRCGRIGEAGLNGLGGTMIIGMEGEPAMVMVLVGVMPSDIVLRNELQPIHVSICLMLR